MFNKLLPKEKSFFKLFNVQSSYLNSEDFLLLCCDRPA